MQVIKILLKQILSYCQLIGVDLKVLLLNFINTPRYIRELIFFKRRGGVVTNYMPFLCDYSQAAGTASGHYFHQDLLIATSIYKAQPIRHIDIGSRIDGFVAHVAAFREIEVIDVRDLVETGHRNIKFLKMDLMQKDEARKNIADSISCLHAIEHFGLGRYGDTIDPNGHLAGIRNIIDMLKPGGVLYISFPIGKKNKIYFNAHRVFSPNDIFLWPGVFGQITLKRFDCVDDYGAMHQDINVANFEVPIEYGCGIYTFVKN